MKKIIAIIAISGLVLGCKTNITYSSFQSVPLFQWATDSVATFTYEAQQGYDGRILLDVRHTNNYPYQNMWLFVGVNTPDTNYVDSIEFYLADDRGHWLGKGRNGLFDMPVLYEQHFAFDSAGVYTFTLQHGMREKALRGVSDIGIIVEKNED